MAHHAQPDPSSANSPRGPKSSGTSRNSAGGDAAKSGAHGKSRERKIGPVPQNSTELSVGRFLRSFHALLAATRLYQKNHPLALSALESTEIYLRAALERVSPIAVGLEDGAIVFCPVKGAEPVALESKASWAGVAESWSARGIRSVLFLPRTNLGELDSFGRLMNETGQRKGDDWPARLAEQRIFGIRVNVPLRQRPGTVLATLVSALMAHSGPNPESHAPRAAGTPATFEDLTAALRLLARLEPIVCYAAQNKPQHTAETLHIALADAEPRTLDQLVRSMTRHAPNENEDGDRYLARLAESLLIETLAAQFLNGRMAAPDLRGVFATLDEAVGRAMSATAGQTEESDNSAALPSAIVRAGRALLPNLPEQETGAAEAYVARLHEKFWDELPARDKATVLRGPYAWCVPVGVVRRYLDQILSASRSSHGDAPTRESRIVVVNYARGVEAEESRPRRITASGLVELVGLIHKLWQEESPVELDRMAVRALVAEVSPGIAGILAALVENLARLAVVRGDFVEFERILSAVESAPRDSEHAHLTALAEKLLADSYWQLMVQKALASRALKSAKAGDSALPRLLARDPERLLDRFAALLAAPDGLNSVPAMARVVRACGEPLLGALEIHLNDPRRQRAGTAIKLLTATEPQRLVGVLPRVLPAWDWNLQDLAIAELTRRDATTKPVGVARAFAEVLPEAHPLVAPVMLDEIGLTGEISAVPLLCKVASGSLEPLRDVFIRIKAIEALGRLRAASAAEMLRTLLRQRQGLVHTEPAGLRAAAEEALALIENHPSSARLRAKHEALTKASMSFGRPRRYFRIPLERPFAARIEGGLAAPARVRTISLGGAFLESNQRLVVGDHIQVDIRAGLRHIRSTAVVRNVSGSGGGVEFLHMPEDSRDRLRRVVRRLQT